MANQEHSLFIDTVKSWLDAADDDFGRFLAVVSVVGITMGLFFGGLENLQKMDFWTPASSGAEILAEKTTEEEKPWWYVVDKPTIQADLVSHPRARAVSVSSFPSGAVAGLRSEREDGYSVGMKTCVLSRCW